MWFVFALTCALCDAFASFFLKKLMNVRISPLSVSFFVHGFGFISLFCYAMLSDTSLSIDINSLILVIFTALIATLAGLLLLHSLQKADLSLISPIQTITPVIVLLLAIVFLSESPKPIGILGISLVVIGGIILDKKPHESFSKIFLRIIKYRPAILAFFAASMYAVISVLDKIALKNVEPIIWITYVYGFIFLFLIPFIIGSKSVFKRYSPQVLPYLLFGVILSVAAIYFQMRALSIGDVSYVMSIKRLSTVVAVFIAMIFLHENRSSHRLRGTLVMVTGAILIGLS